MCSDGLASGLELGHIMWSLRVKLGGRRESRMGEVGGESVPNSTEYQKTALQDLINFQLGVYIMIVPWSR